MILLIYAVAAPCILLFKKDLCSLFCRIYMTAILFIAVLQVDFLLISGKVHASFSESFGMGMLHMLLSILIAVSFIHAVELFENCASSRM